MKYNTFHRNKERKYQQIDNVTIKDQLVDMVRLLSYLSVSVQFHHFPGFVFSESQVVTRNNLGGGQIPAQDHRNLNGRGAAARPGWDAAVQAAHRGTVTVPVTVTVMVGGPPRRP